ncbi:putative coiled-coil protein SlyX [Pedobacter cryoconitis]|uniref:hypothetical protein n=1 Tax=Pedobacter cryoconitis TaxID=188932 RepID=UPI001609B685|nr:hypothetical protein [Pedobacter cryoconitis]MBB6273346.1 putative coiled-coil protein SlyX [Pedobacter cryoconitis]
MKYIYSLILSFLVITGVNAQVLTGPAGYKVISLGDNGLGDYTRSLILLHEAYNGTLLPFNNAIGTITGFRGNAAAYNRVNIVTVNTASSYNNNLGTIQSYAGDSPWKLKTCIYNGKKYMALEVPYADSYHEKGFQFSGWTNSTGESLKVINYMSNGIPVNQTILTDIQDFVANMTETHNVQQMNVFGNLNIGTDVTTPGYQFQVKGKVRAQEVLVETGDTWPDYVFEPSYEKLSLTELDKFIQTNKHLPEVPSAKVVQKEGIKLGEMNATLLKKIEELTLYVIEQDKRLNNKDEDLNKLKEKLNSFEDKLNRIVLTPKN